MRRHETVAGSALAIVIGTNGCAALPAPAGRSTDHPVLAAHRAVATRSAASQRAFDAGLLMLDAFDMPEARARFARAAASDPQNALAYAGEALADVSDINVTPSTADEARAGAAAARARRASEIAARDRPLVAALAIRFASHATIAYRMHAFDLALRRAALRAPGDPLVAFVAVAAAYHGEPNVEAPSQAWLAGALDRAVAAAPDDPGIRHMRIHYFEDTGRPRDALADANYLNAHAVPIGASHLLHMPSHVYNRTGAYDRAADANLAALANDAAFFRLGDGPAQRYMRDYEPHDIANALYELTAVGRDAAAVRLASDDGARRALVALRLHRDRAVLADPAAPPFARALALARTGDARGAARAIAIVEHDGDDDSDAACEIALVRAATAAGPLGRTGTAARRAAAAALREDAVAYRTCDERGDPPARWASPPAETFGRDLIRAGDSVRAAAVFRDALRVRPADPRLVFGLRAALAAGGGRSASAGAATKAPWHGTRPLRLDDLG